MKWNEDEIYEWSDRNILQIRVLEDSDDYLNAEVIRTDTDVWSSYTIGHTRRDWILRGWKLVAFNGLVRVINRHEI